MASAWRRRPRLQSMGLHERPEIRHVASVHWRQTGAALAVVLSSLGCELERPQATSHPTPSPSPAERLVWSPERAEQDWPLPVRREPPGPPVLITPDPAPPREPGTGIGPFDAASVTDPSGDRGVMAPGWVDITRVWVSFTIGDASLSGVTFSLAAHAPVDIPHPRERWVAYGLVVDLNGDGQGDLRLGMDNAPDGEHRAWKTELATGATQAQTGPGYGVVGDFFFDTYFPGEKVNGRMLVEGQEMGQFKFYVWASLIEDGRVVATDYAPNVGWIDPGDPVPCCE